MVLEILVFPELFLLFLQEIQFISFLKMHRVAPAAAGLAK